MNGWQQYRDKKQHYTMIYFIYVVVLCVLGAIIAVSHLRLGVTVLTLVICAALIALGYHVLTVMLDQLFNYCKDQVSQSRANDARQLEVDEQVTDELDNRASQYAQPGDAAVRINDLNR